jgi:DNA-binding MarR family transcriptional regulator
MLHRRVTGIYDEALRPLGIRISQLNVLAAVAKMGEQATASRVGSFLMIEKSTLSRDLKLMRKRGWLSRSGTPRSLRVTKRGSELIEHVLPVWGRAQQRTMKLLGRHLLQGISERALQLRVRG